MSKIRVQSFAISIDGYGAGSNQDLQNPLGVNGSEWNRSAFVGLRMLDVRRRRTCDSRVPSQAS
jgi:hypothetical protein